MPLFMDGVQLPQGWSHFKEKGLELVSKWHSRKGPGTSFQATFFTEFFDKKFCFIILHKLAKYHYSTVFTSQVIQ